jgi:hypothetical protein
MFMLVPVEIMMQINRREYAREFTREFTRKSTREFALQFVENIYSTASVGGFAAEVLFWRG